MTVGDLGFVVWRMAVVVVVLLVAGVAAINRTKFGRENNEHIAMGNKTTDKPKIVVYGLHVNCECIGRCPLWHLIETNHSDWLVARILAIVKQSFAPVHDALICVTNQRQG